MKIRGMEQRAWSDRQPVTSREQPLPSDRPALIMRNHDGPENRMKIDE